jgi:hypothetical protein
LQPSAVPNNRYRVAPGEDFMRAEIETVVEEIQQAIALLRRHL